MAKHARSHGINERHIAGRPGSQVGQWSAEDLGYPCFAEGLDRVELEVGTRHGVLHLQHLEFIGVRGAGEHALGLGVLDVCPGPREPNGL